MHVPDLEHEFRVSPHILPQVFICGIHKVTKFAPRDLVEVPWDKFGFDTVLEELPSVAMVLPFLLSHYPPPCGGIAFQVGLGKLHGRVPSNLGDIQIVLHFYRPSIHNLLVTGTIEVPGFGWLEPCILGCSSFESCNQLTKVRPIHLEEDFQLFLGE
jgi:hypothetical protein